MNGLTRNMDTGQIPYDIWYARYGTVNEIIQTALSGSALIPVQWMALTAMLTIEAGIYGLQCRDSC